MCNTLCHPHIMLFCHSCLHFDEYKSKHVYNYRYEQYKGREDKTRKEVQLSTYTTVFVSVCPQIQVKIRIKAVAERFTVHKDTGKSKYIL